jgi:trigger factor
MSDFQFSIEETGPVARTLKVTVTAEHVSGSFDRAYNKLRGQAKVDGFRKGKVPRTILEQRYGADVEQDVLGQLVEDGCSQAIRENSLKLAVSPKVADHTYSAEAGLSFEATLELVPTFELGDYKDLTGVRRVVITEETEIDEAVENLRARMAVLQTEEERQTVESGDILTLGMYGFDGDEPVAGTEQSGVQLEVGAGRFPEQFEEQLLGAKVGEKTPVNVDFEDDHANTELAGKKIRFDVTVDTIKTKILPDVDEDFVKELGLEEGATVESLRTRIREDLEGKAGEEADANLRDELLGALVDRYDFALPESLVADHTHQRLHDLGVAHAEEGSIPEERLAEIKEGVDKQARAQLTAGYLLDAIAGVEELETDKAELEARIRHQIMTAGDRADEVRKHFGQASALAGLRTQILREKAVSRILELSSVQEEEVPRGPVAEG